MRKTIFFASVLLASSIAQAEELKISIENRSDQPILIVKFDDTRLTLPAHTKIDNQIFHPNDKVLNYINGEYKCIWRLKAQKDERITGIFYSDKYDYGCVVIVEPK